MCMHVLYTMYMQNSECMHLIFKIDYKTFTGRFVHFIILLMLEFKVCFRMNLHLLKNLKHLIQRDLYVKMKTQ